VVEAVDVPVTLKIRTGIAPPARNGVRIAQIAQESGIQMLAVHGRTRADRFSGDAEYDTIAEIVSQISIPVLANGDITHVDKARAVLDYTGAAGVMIGRGAQGKPWLPGAIARALSGEGYSEPTLAQRLTIAQDHLAAVHVFYGDVLGVRIARKHMGWFLDDLMTAASNATSNAAITTINSATNTGQHPATCEWAHWRKAFNAMESAALQQRALAILGDALVSLESNVTATRNHYDMLPLQLRHLAVTGSLNRPCQHGADTQSHPTHRQTNTIAKQPQIIAA